MPKNKANTMPPPPPPLSSSPPWDATDAEIESAIAKLHLTLTALGAEMSVVVRRTPVKAILSTERIYSLTSYRDKQAFLNAMDRCEDRRARNPRTLATVQYSSASDFGRYRVPTTKPSSYEQALLLPSGLALVPVTAEETAAAAKSGAA